MMQRNEYCYLVHLLKCGLNNSVPAEKPVELSWSNIYEAAVSHDVVPLAYVAINKLKSKPEADILKKWEQGYFVSFSRNAKQMKARKEITDALHHSGIYTLEVQGTRVKKYYPSENLRMMSDIDFIIPEEKANEAREILRSLGYDANEAYGNETEASKAKVFVELHNDFFDDRTELHDALNNPFQYAELHEDYSAEVPDTIFYLYCMLHILKHFRYSGMGISRVLDVFVLKNALSGSVDTEYIDGVLEKSGLKKDMEKLYYLSDYWFGGAESLPWLEKLENYVFESCRHGTEEIFMTNIIERNMEQNEKKGKHFLKLRQMFSRIFAPKEDIYSAYPNLKEHNVPVVFCWIYRLFSIMFSGEKKKRFHTFIKRLRKIDRRAEK